MSNKVVYVHTWLMDIAEITVERETPKMYVVGSVKQLVGRVYVPERVRKEDTFPTLRATLEHMQKMGKRHLDDTEKRLQSIKTALNDIEMLLGALDMKGIE